MKDSIDCKYQKRILPKLGKNGDVSEGFTSSLTESRLGPGWSLGIGGTQEKFHLLSADLWTPPSLSSLIADHHFLFCRQRNMQIFNLLVLSYNMRVFLPSRLFQFLNFPGQDSVDVCLKPICCSQEMAVMVEMDDCPGNLRGGVRGGHQIKGCGSPKQ